MPKTQIAAASAGAGAKVGGQRAPRPSGDDNDQVAELLVRVARRLHRSALEELRPMGLTHAQGRALHVVSRSAEPIRMADLAAALEVVPRSATAMVDALEAVGLVRRFIDPHDRRSLRVVTTRDGLDLLGRLAAARGRTAEAVFQPLSSDDRCELGRLLAAVCGCAPGHPEARASGAGCSPGHRPPGDRRSGAEQGVRR